MERYVGVRFVTVFRDRRSPADAAAGAIVRWARAFAEAGFSPPGESALGNLSLRCEPGFLVTPTHVPFLALGRGDVVHVLAADVEAGRVEVRGAREPSSETLLHHLVYDARPDVGAVFHGHSEPLLRSGEGLGIPVTAEAAPYGTVRLARLAAAVAARADFFLLRDHGFVSLGAGADEAGARALEALARATA